MLRMFEHVHEIGDLAVRAVQPCIGDDRDVGVRMARTQCLDGFERGVARVMHAEQVLNRPRIILDEEAFEMLTKMPFVAVQRLRDGDTRKIARHRRHAGKEPADQHAGRDRIGNAQQHAEPTNERYRPGQRVHHLQPLHASLPRFSVRLQCRYWPRAHGFIHARSRIDCYRAGCRM
jgi:hypothetical protein